MSILAGVLAFYSKETAYSLPVALGMIEGLFFSQNQRNLRQWALMAILLILPLMITVSVRYSDTFVSLFTTPIRTGKTNTVNSPEYFLTQLLVIPKYFSLIVLPINQNLDANFPMSKSVTVPHVISFICLLSAVALAIIFRHKSKILAFSVLWIFITLAVESSIVPIADAYNEHRLYLPMAGVVIGLVVVLQAGLQKKQFLFYFVSLAIILGWSFLTFQRNKVWALESLLWQDVVNKSPSNSRGYFNLGRAYYYEGNYVEAYVSFQKALQIFPEFAQAYYFLGLIALKAGMFQDALDLMRTADGLKPGDQQFVEYIRQLEEHIQSQE